MGPSQRQDQIRRYLGLTIAVGVAPGALAFDGASIWVANSGSKNVTKLRASDGVVLGTFDVGPEPSAVVFDGIGVWVANAGNSTLSRL